MSETYNRQTRLFPTATHKLTGDGAPLHSRLGIDLMTGVNNIAYTYPWFGYVQAYSTKHSDSTVHDGGYLLGISSTDAAFPDGEYFLAQVPTVLPVVANHRFCWTLGITPPVATADTGDCTISAVNVYLSPEPYVGTISTDSVIGVGHGPSPTTNVFDPSKMGAPYGVSSKSTSIVSTNPTANPAYNFVDNSAGITGDWAPWEKLDGELYRRVNLIVTCHFARTVHGSGEPVIEVKVHDFSWWVVPE